MNQKLIGSNVGRLEELDFVTGIQRVTLGLHRYIDQNLDKNFFKFQGYSREEIILEKKFLKNPTYMRDPILNQPRASLEDIDVLLLLDLDMNLDFQSIMEVKSRKNLKIVTNIYDLLPLQNPEWFSLSNSRPAHMSWLLRILRISDHLVFNSDSSLKVFEELQWNFEGSTHVIPLGAMDTKYSLPFFIAPPKTILCVSTIEPRKGHDDLLNAYDNLLSSGEDYRLIFVGKYGWNSEDLVKRIYGHPEYGKRFRWYEKVNDDELLAIYNSATICVVPSYGEGFGLSIEEALIQGLPVLARNIPVFRERNYSNLFFFDGGGERLSTAIIKSSKAQFLPGHQNVRKMSQFSADFYELIMSLV
jgi:glycosyltransferase involved in cell wall biosynthesis